MTVKTPIVASTPLKTITAPSSLLLALEAHLKLHKLQSITAPVQWHDGFRVFQRHGVYNPYKKEVLVKESPLTSELEDLAYKTLTPAVTEWAQSEVRRTWSYGAIEYSYGSKLVMNRARKETHVLSALLNIDQQVNTPWPLDFVDQEGIHHEITLETGEILLYESLCPHGRTKALDGTFYKACYFHWMPEEWDCSVMEGVQSDYYSLSQAIKDMAKVA